MGKSGLEIVWHSLKDNFAFRVGTVYAGGSWFVVQAADTLGGSDVVVRGIAVALAVGFLTVVPVAWFMDRRARKGETSASGDGQPGIATRFFRHVRSRTGTRRWVATLVILVVLAGALWFGGTRVYGGSVPEAATKIAVIPFQGTGSAAAREFGIGIVDLLSAALDHVGDIRTVSARTVLARTGSEPGNAPSLDEALDIGADVRAGSIVTGSVTTAGQNVRLTAEIRAIADAAVLASASTEGPEADILALTDELAVTLLRDMWRSREPLPTVATAGLLTSSPAALREYMRGERLLRSNRFDSATAAFRSATRADTAFALAWMRLAESTGWGQEVETVFDRRVYSDNAARHAARLPVRERALVRAVQLKLKGAFDAADSISAYVSRYPDDPYGWYLLGDTRYHDMHVGLFSEAEVIDPFLEAVRLDPSLALGLRHVIDHALETGDRQQFDALMHHHNRVAPPDEIAGLEAAARLRWAPADSVLAVFLTELRALRSVENRATIVLLAGTLGDRVRLDPMMDPDVYIQAMDSSLAYYAGDRDWQRLALARIVDALFAFGRAREGFDRLDQAIAIGMPLPPVPPDMRRPTARLMTAVRFALPASLVSQDAERIDGAQHILPFFPALLRLYWTQAGELERAAAYPIAIELPADVPSQDTTAIRLSLQGWEFAVRGDRETGLGLIEDGFHRLGTNDVWIVGPVVFVFAELLSQQPDRRTQGIRALRWFTRNSQSDTGRAWLALGRALEADGDAAGARDAYGHVLRVWADADDYLADEVGEARTALQRLTAEIG